ncbi:hypothetical protein CARUB_v10015127mg [Capsella rubella]|uniref:DUF4283 domain-containing protein n=1 Tax=Capsella rubella TaxID=81985 RepID=R0I662_9BRAS|nr:uncharacterized protein LOC17893244 [Capsella rubella]EOA31898.1 hypothetical protein CARUB_v10015127mg [Capsella rubella]
MALINRRRRPRYLSLGLADPQITVPETAYAEVREKNRRSLVGRVVGPEIKRQDLYSLIDKLPLEWFLDESKCRGRLIGGGKFQFVFERDRDLEMVLWSGPYTFNGWLVVLEKWEDEPGPGFLKSVPMWLKIRGIPVQYISDGTIREIASSMGEVTEVELDDEMFDLRYVRARVNVAVYTTRLCFKKVVRFDTGEVKIVSFGYEDIGRSKAKFKFCRNCGALNHLTRSCSVPWVDVPDPYGRALSPPPHESCSSDGSNENNGEGGTLELLLGPADASDDVVHDLPNVDGEQQQKDLGGVEEADGTQVQSDMVGTSPEGSKRKFDATGEADDNLEKRLRGSADASESLGVNLKPLQEE